MDSPSLAQEEAERRNKDAQTRIKQWGNFAPAEDICKEVMAKPTSTEKKLCCCSSQHSQIFGGSPEVGGGIENNTLGKGIKSNAFRDH
jgi:hypothetical protein